MFTGSMVPVRTHFVCGDVNLAVTFVPKNQAVLDLLGFAAEVASPLVREVEGWGTTWRRCCAGFEECAPYATHEIK